MAELFLRILFIITPMYFANASALFFGGKRRIDFGKNFYDNKPILGKGKTFEGTIGGILTGIASTILVQLIFWDQTALVSQQYFLLGVLLTVGAIVGDVAASFIKRRIGKEQGASIPFLDQLDFIAGGLVFAIPLFIPKIEELAIILLLTLVAHALTNRLAFMLKLKKVPW